MKLKFYKYALKNIKLYIICVIVLVLGILFSLLGPYLMGKIIDDVVIASDTSLLWPLGIAMFLSYALTGLLHYLEEYNSDKISKLVASNIRLDLFSWIQKEDGSFFRERSAADLMSRTTTDTNYIGFTFGYCIVYTVQALCSVVAISIAICAVNPLGAIIPFAFLPIIVFLSYKAEVKGDKIMDDLSDQSANINQVAGEAIKGIRTVKAFGTEDKERKRFAVYNKKYRDLHNRIDYLWTDWYAPVDALARAMILINILLCGTMVIGEKMSLGDFTIVFQYTSQLTMPITEFGWLLRMFAQARSGGRKINKIMEREPLVVSGEDTIENNAETLEFKNVSFSHQGKTLLDDVSFKLEKGKTLAIMGASGSGKSLIASLAVRFIDPTEGEVVIDGKNIRNCTLDSVRSFSSIVTQDVFLFSDSIINNIRLGQRDSLDREICVESARKANASSFIENLSNGYDTVIGERGVGLSGGQKQRLSIARSFSKKCRLIILDDATSALDMETERDIEDTLKHQKDMSMMIIAHRISAVSFADEIIVLEAGRIKERGTHKTLMEKKGLYYQTYLSQYPESV